MQWEDGAVSILDHLTIGDFIQAELAVVEFHLGSGGWGVHQMCSPEYSKASIELERVDPTVK